MFPVIYADPAWKFKAWNSHLWRSKADAGRNPESHYPTLTLAELKRLPVASIAAPDCALFMWATYPMLLQATALGEAWGFEYKTVAFTWAKVNRGRAGRMGWFSLEDERNWFMGLGYWTRANPEICLLFTRGKPKRRARNVRNLIVSGIRKHSQKPEDAYNRIEALIEGPYCELFARAKRPGWSSWGNEIDNDFELEECDG